MKNKFLSILFLCLVFSTVSASNDGVKEGYRGFFSVGGTIGVGDYSLSRFELSTSHGYQVCPYFFAGAGLSYSYWCTGWWGLNYHGLTPFLNLRSDFLNKPITPFFDARLGYTFIDVSGVYFCPSIGCRFGGKNSRFAGSISIGYTVQMDKTYEFSFDDYDFDLDFTRENVGGITLRGTFEF